MRTLLRVVSVALAVAYPVIVYTAIRAGHEEWALVALLVLAAVGASARWLSRPRAEAGSPAPRPWLSIAPSIVTVFLLVALVRLTGDRRLLFALPVLVNLAMLGFFARTLAGGQMPMIERFARLVEPDLDEPKQAHCRQFTKIWCGYFLVNAAVSGGLAVAGALGAWALYTGLISYLGMGLLFAAELTLRVRRFGPDGSGLPGRLLSRMFGRSP
jgi:uncharacterized membrane protein